MALKRQNPLKTDSTCYIESLPTEISNSICHLIDEKDILNLRLASKFWNNIATFFFPRNVNLVFKPESFRRILEISRHPVISKQVTSLYYQPNILDEYVSQEKWEKRIAYSGYPRNFERCPGPDASERSLRCWRRNLTKYRARHLHRYSRGYVKKAYKGYTQRYAEQEDLRNRNYGLKELSNALSHFPNLSEICLNHGRAIYEPPIGFRDLFAGGLLSAGEDYCGIPFMRSLLHAIQEADVALNELQISSVDWRFLQQSGDAWVHMKSALRHLTILELEISTAMEDHRDGDFGVEIPTCRRYLDNNTNKLPDFLAAARNLKHLKISFQWHEPCCPAELEQVFGNVTWPCLESIILEYIDATSVNLDRFFRKHASTLKHLSMETVCLQKGNWPKTLERMNKVLNLKSADFRGYLLGEYPSQRWRLEPDALTELGYMRSQGIRTRKAVEEFLVRGGCCPLIDNDAHPFQSDW